MSDAPPPAEPPAPRGPLGIIFLIVLIDFLGFGIIIPLLPFYVPDYQRNPMKVTLLFSIFSICQFFGAPVLGAISDRHGRRPVLAFSQLGSAAGYVLLGLATQFPGLSPGAVLLLVYLSRIIDGFTGGNVSTAQAYISDVTTPETRAKGMGLLGAAFGIGFSLGPAIGGILGHYHVSIPAYVAAALAALAAGLTFARLPESRVHKPVDVEAWLHPSRFAPVLRRPVLMQLMAVGFFTMAAFVMMESTITLFLNKHFGYSERQVGWYFAFMGLIIILVQGGLIRRLVPAVGEWPLAILGPVLVAIGMFGLTWTAWLPALSLLLLAGAVNAVGRSLQQPTLSSLLSKFTGAEEQGVTFGLYHGAMSIARVLGPVVAGLAYPWLKNTGPFLVAAALTLACAAWTASLRSAAPAPETSTSTEVPIETV
jgi:MFS family permease